MYVQFQIPANKYERVGRSSWSTVRVTQAPASSRTPDRKRRLVSGISCARVCRAYVVDQAGRGRPGSTEVGHSRGAKRKSKKGDIKGGTELPPSFGRITDDGAWTAWFGHLVPPNSTILTGTLIPRGDHADPNPNPDSLQACIAIVSNRERGPDAGDASGRDRSGARGFESLLCARALTRQLVPNAEVSTLLPGSTCPTCDPDGTHARQLTWTPQNLAALVEPTWWRHRRHALSIWDNGPPHDSNPERAPDISTW